MKYFLIKVIIFFTPIVLCYLIVENHLRNLPTIVNNKAKFYNTHKKDIKILVLGASRNKDAINPELISKSTSNLALSAQDYFISNKLLRKVAPNLPNLNTVIIPCTFGHFESGPNQKKTWRNSMYRYFFKISLEDKFTYFKDDFMYLDHSIYYQNVINRYEDGTFKKDSSVYFTDISNSEFFKMKYDSLTINSNEFKILPDTAHPEYIEENLKSLDSIISYCNKNNYNVIINDTPLSDPYKKIIIVEVIKRRDSIRSVIRSKYKVEFFDPQDSLQFYLKDFKDYNHLSPTGAEKYTKALNDFIKSNHY